MSSNGANVEDAEMAECEGEKVVTMMDVLQEQQEFEEDANAVLGASDDKNCTYSKGYIKRQALYACLTCCSDAKDDPEKRAGVCLACSLTCHENHDLVELYTKRNFRCDCGNPKFNHPCHYTENKTTLNDENVYNQNFSGLYCVCHRPYPDPDGIQDEMIQCIVCEDWLHTSHLEATVPSHDLYAEMVCKACMDKNEFLHDYNKYAVNGDVDVVSIDESVDSDKPSNGEVSEMNGIDAEKSIAESVDSEKPSNGDVSEMNGIHAEKNKAESVNVNELADPAEPMSTSQENVDENKEEVQMIPNLPVTENTEDEDPVTEENNDETHDVKTVGEDSLAKDQVSEKTDNADPSEATQNENADPSEAIQTENAEPSETTQTENADPSEITQTENVDPSETIQTENADPSETIQTENVDPLETIQTENANVENKPISDEISASVEIADNKDSLIKELEHMDVSNNKDTDANITEQNDSKNLSDTPQENSNIEDNVSTVSTAVTDTKDQETLDATNDKINGDSGATDTNMSEQNQESNGDNVGDKAKVENETGEGIKIGSPEKQNDPDNSPATSSDNTKVEPIQVTNDHVEVEDLKENKRKLSTEESVVDISAKRVKLSDSDCRRPRIEKKKFKGASFWPCHFRQKLCTCSECITMYKDLSVLFLTELEDTVAAYEALGKQKTDGAALTQYEKGLEALSSLGRIQQINALTEYNKMKDKLLDFLKSFKERKQVVKEEDIKAFFAGMKPKREPDVPPLSVEIRLNNNVDFEAGQPRVVDCVVVGCVPPPSITWHLGDTLLRPTVHKELHDGNYTVSSLTLAPSLRDGGRELACRAHNSHLPGQVFQDQVTLNVGYRPVCLSSGEETIGAVQGEAETVTCVVEASPEPLQFSWTFADSRTLYTSVKKVPGHQHRYSSTLTWLPRAGDYGALLCRATNSFGEQKRACMYGVAQGGPPAAPRCALRETHAPQVQCKKGWDGGRPQTIHLILREADGTVVSNASDAAGHFQLPRAERNLSAVVYASNSRGRSEEMELHLQNSPMSAFAVTEHTPSRPWTRWLELAAIGIAVAATVAATALCVRALRARAAQVDNPDLVPRSDGTFHREPDFVGGERVLGTTNITVNQLAACQNQYSSSPVPSCRVLVGCPRAPPECPATQHSYFV